jgi:phosphate transport system permease protein
MTTLDALAPSAPLELTARKLPTRAPLFTAAGAVAVALALRTGLSWTGWMTTAAAAIVLHVVALTAWSLTTEGRRHAADRAATIAVSACLVAAVTPLVLILGYIAVLGAPALSWDFLTHSMNGVTGARPGGGVYHALIGTVQQVGLATVIAVPIGILTAIYLVEFGRGRFAKAVTFFVDVMNGVPSIVAGLFVFSVLLLGFGMRPFGAAGSLALTILMLPIVIRSAEEMIRLVPADLREASYALGVPKWRTVLKVVLPTALSGLVTGVLLSIARIVGETAPLVLLVGYASQINGNPFVGDQASLPVMIWDQLGKRSGNAGAFAEPRAWGAALVLVLLVLALNIGARLAARWLGSHKRSRGQRRGRRHTRRDIRQSLNRFRSRPA